MSHLFAILIGKAGFAYQSLPRTYYFESDGWNYYLRLFSQYLGLIQ